MRSLELPSGSILVNPLTKPDGVYEVKGGLVGVFDRFERLLMVLYESDLFGLESLFDMSCSYMVRSLSFVELSHYDVEEFKGKLDGDLRRKVVEEMARWKFYIERRYDMESGERIRDIYNEMKDRGVEQSVLEQVVVGLSLSDALEFEKIRGEEE